jgi:beta-lactamase regulating signal transducer with metallopeptidase domain/uncharacterized GH25 family protein
MTWALNSFADQWWPYVYHATWQAALVAVIAMALVYLPGLRRLPSPWRYAILLIALIKFAIPPILPANVSKLGVFYWVAPAVASGQETGGRSQEAGVRQVVAPTASQRQVTVSPHPDPLPGSEGAVTAIAPAVTTQPEPRRSAIRNLQSAIAGLSWTAWLMLIHAAGAVAVLAWILIGFIKLAAIARRAEPIGLNPQSKINNHNLLHDSLTRLSRRLDIKDEVDLLITREAIPPVAYWLLRPKIMLPASLVERLPAEALETILAHELVHHRRNDWAANWLQLLLCAGWWFNPLVWLLSSALRRTREECCDDALLGNQLTTRDAYSRTLVTAAEQMHSATTFPTTLGFGERPHPVAQRLKRILDPTLYRAPKLSGPGLIAAAILCIAILPGLRSKAQEPLAARPQQQLPDVLKVSVVEEETNRSVAGATVHVWGLGTHLRETTNEQGIAEVRYDASTYHYASIRAVVDGRVPMGVRFQREPEGAGIPAAFTLKVPKGTRIAGRVVDAAGQPVEEATVEIATMGMEPPGIPRPSIGASVATYKTDENGRWSSDIAPPKLDALSITVKHPQFTTASLHGDWWEGLDGGEAGLRDGSARIVLRTGATIAGRITDRNEAPIAGATVRLGQFSYASSEAARTDDEGGYEIRNIKSGPQTVTVSARGYAPQMVVFGASEQAGALDFKLEPGRVLRGRVLDRDGQPIAGAQVMSREWKWRDHDTLGMVLQTEADGRFEWDSAPEDPFKISVSKEGYMSAWKYEVRAGDQEHVVTLGPPLRIRGSVVDAQTRQPIDEFHVIHGEGAYQTGQEPYWYRSTAKAERGGQFEAELDFPRERGHLIRIETDGYEPGISRPIASDEGTIELAFELVKSNVAQPQGVVLGPDGRPAVEATVCVATPDFGVFIKNGAPMVQNSFVMHTFTDKAGHFKMPPVGGRWMLVIAHESGYLEIDQRQYVPDATVTLEPWGRIEGVLYIGSKPAAEQTVGTQIGVYPEHRKGEPYVNMQGIEATTDDQGRFVLEHIRPGEVSVCRLVPLGQGSRAYQQSKQVVVKPGETVSVTLGGGGRPVIGRVAEGQTPVDFTFGQHRIGPPTQTVGIGRALFGLVFPAPPTPPRPSFSFTVEPDGAFRVDDVPAGEYELELKFTEPRQPWQDGPVIAKAQLRFTVPPIADDERDTPFDVGTIRVERIDAP